MAEQEQQVAEPVVADTAIAEPPVAEAPVEDEKVSSAQDQLAELLSKEVGGDEPVSDDKNADAKQADEPKASEAERGEVKDNDPASDDAGEQVKPADDKSDGIDPILRQNAEGSGFKPEEIAELGEEKLRLNLAALDRITINRMKQGQPAKTDNVAPTPALQANEPPAKSSIDLEAIRSENPLLADAFEAMEAKYGKAIEQANTKLAQYETANAQQGESLARDQFDAAVAKLSPIYRKIIGEKFGDELTDAQIKSRNEVGEAMQALAQTNQPYTVDSLVRSSMDALYGNEIRSLSDQENAVKLRKKTQSRGNLITAQPAHNRKLDTDKMDEMQQLELQIAEDLAGSYSTFSTIAGVEDEQEVT